MTDLFDWTQLAEWVEGPCAHCSDTPGHDSEHVAMGVSRPHYVDKYIDDIAGPDEKHEVADDGHCINPKCRYTFSDIDKAEIERAGGQFTCPKCGYTYDYNASEKNPTYPEDEDQRHDLGLTRERPANPGGTTRSGLSLEEMGRVGEQVIARMGELPGVGVIAYVSEDYHGPIDAIVEGQQGKFGCEIKANHSTAQERFKIGGKKERQAKITYCLTNGLKPALIGVRLNFYTDKAYIFFREGLTDTWIGNAKMLHVATVDFADLNPFQSPDMQAQALAVDNANLPDQSDAPDDEFSDEFGQVAAKVASPDPDAGGKITFKDDVHELKVIDKNGKHTHTAKRCQHCGTLYHKVAGHKGRVECPTCGEDPERALYMAKVILAGTEADDTARQLGFTFLGRNQRGHRQYLMQSGDGIKHMVVVGAGGAHGKKAEKIAADRARQRMTRCLNASCNHLTPKSLAQEDEPGSPVVRAGAVLKSDSAENYVHDADGGVSLVLDLGKLGQRDAATKVGDTDPAYLYVYYMGELHVEPYDVNVSYERMLSDLMDEFGVDMGNTAMDIDPTKVDAGELRPRGFTVSIKHKQLSEPEVREYAERAIHDWWYKNNNSSTENPWQTLPSDALNLHQ